MRFDLCDEEWAAGAAAGESSKAIKCCVHDLRSSARAKDTLRSGTSCHDIPVRSDPQHVFTVDWRALLFNNPLDHAAATREPEACKVPCRSTSQTRV